MQKAFDSLFHNYMLGVIEAYEFGSKKFNIWVKLLHKDLKADILANEFRTDKINNEQSVKQCTALLCLLMISCMNPQIVRVIEGNQI